MRISKKLLEENIRMIGLSGTAIRFFDYLFSFFSEDALVYRKVSRKCGKWAKECLNTHIKYNENSTNDTIWVMWLQGYDTMPDLVKQCYDRLTEIHSEQKVVLITFENYQNYVKLPTHIYEKVDRGIIEFAQFSDILRTALLYAHGGIWVDSTMFFTRPIPQFIWKQEFFVFKYFNKKSRQICSSQFIRAKAGNSILGGTLNVLFKYWSKSNKMISYYQWHYIFSLVANSKKEYKQIINSIPKYFSEMNHILQNCFFEAYDEEYWRYIKNCSFVQKLSYKHLNDPRLAHPNTYYSYFRNRELI